jgi:adenylate kinase family enzyme
MRRVLIVGCSGAGRSTFARALSERAGLPLIHLDAQYWQPGWREPWSGRVAHQGQGACRGGRLVIDGNYTATMAPRFARADTMIFIDLSTRV